MKIYAYKNGSKSAKALAEALNCKLIKHEGKALNAKGYVINWGASNIERFIIGFVLNLPENVQKAVNKLTAFEAMKGQISIPDFTTDPEEANKWLQEGKAVVLRMKLNGHSGEGIEIISEKGDYIRKAPLYTKYILKEQEWRVHVFRGEVFFVQRKARKLDVPDEQVNWKVRNLAGGFIYANQNIEAPEEVKKQAIAAITALGLDFGAVDVITTKKGKAFVLEVNTACGLEGTTLDKYVEQFKKLEQV